MKKILLLLGVCILFAPTLFAGGPKKIAKINRSLWPYKINSAAEFDFASKMEMLVFARVLLASESITAEDSIKKYLGLEKISTLSITKWKEQVKKVLVANFNVINTTTNHDFIEIHKPQSWQQITNTANTLENKIPGNLKAWFTNATEFYDSYIYEQMRLAALFPRVTSEILTLQSSEIIGFDYPDKQFLLTFDDGPTVAGGNTDKLISTLNKNNINGIFFVLGDMFNARLKATSVQKLNAVYKPMVIGSHGKVHTQHPRDEHWKYSLSFTNHLIDSVAPENKKTKYFRPPYGQRNDKMITYLNENNSKVMLWNIDSQDWNAKITSNEVADRVITLMLLWRRGIILFHDIHPKANAALPAIWEGFHNCNVQWIDAKQLN